MSRGQAQRASSAGFLKGSAGVVRTGSMTAEAMAMKASRPSTTLRPRSPGRRPAGRPVEPPPLTSPPEGPSPWGARGMPLL